MTKPFSARDLPAIILLSLTAFLVLYPFIYMVSTSFKDTTQFYNTFYGPAWPLHLENYRSAWQMISRYVFNSVLITATSTAGVLIVSCLSAYVFARHSFPGKEFLFYAVIFVMMVPFVLTLIPQFILIRDMGLLNTYTAYLFPYISGGQVFAIFIMRNFFAALPEELFESARIDGASELQVMRHVLIPLAQPILITVGIIEILGTWNDLIWPMAIAVRDEMRTLPVGLMGFTTASQTQFGPMFAGYTIASIPLILVFLLTMRQFIAGLTSGAIKG
jgi:multiple sugar transport system permease protein/raffinose/stachyose/melibiose transport system permease protein